MSQTTIFFLYVFVFFQQISFAQNIDDLCEELYAYAEKMGSDSASLFVEDKIKSLTAKDASDLKIELAIIFQKETRLQTSLELLESIARNEVRIESKCKYYYTQARNYINTTKIEEGKTLLDSSDTYKQFGDNKNFYADIPRLYGSIYFYKGELLNATRSFSQAANIYEEMGENDDALVCRANLAAINIETRNFSAAIKNLQVARSKIELPQHERNLGIILNNLAIAYQHIDLDSSLYYSHLSKKINPNKWSYYNTVGNVLIRKKEYAKAQEALIRAGQIADSLELVDEANYSGSSLCKLYSEMGQNQKALLCFDKYDHYFKNTQSAIAKRDFLRDLAKAKYASNVKDLDLVNYFTMADSIENDMVYGAVQTALLDAELKEEQDSLKMLSIQNIANKEKLNFQSKLNKLYLFALLLSGFIIYFLYRFFKEEKRNNRILQEKHSELMDQNQNLLEDKQVKDGDENKLTTAILSLTNREKTQIPLNQIIYLESRDKSVYVNIINDIQYRDWQSLKSFKEILPPSEFVQIHRSYIVNVSHIAEAKSNVIKLSNGESLSVSRSYKNEVLSVLKNLDK